MREHLGSLKAVCDGLRRNFQGILVSFPLVAHTDEAKLMAREFEQMDEIFERMVELVRGN